VRRLLIGFLVVANLGVFGGLGALWFAARQVTGAIGTVEGDLDLAARPRITDPATFLLVGSDSREGVPDHFTNIGKFGGQRADVIMLMKIIPAESRVQILSLPRDLKITYQGRTQRINAVYNQGAAALVEAVRTVTPEPIHHYLEVNFAGFAAIVDAVGGIEMAFPYAARDRKSGLSIPAGTHVLDGQQALQLARSRSYEENRNGRWVFVDASDIGRTGRQQDLLMALIAQVKRPGSIGEFKTLVQALGGFVKSDAALDEDDVIELGWQMRNIGPGQIDAMTLPVAHSTEGGVAYVVAVEPGAGQALAAFGDGKPFQEAVTGTVAIEVQNGTDVSGSAGAIATRLEAGGYSITAVTNSDRSDYQKTLVIARPRALPQAEAVAAALGYGQVMTGATPKGVDVVVIVGFDAVP